MNLNLNAEMIQPTPEQRERLQAALHQFEAAVKEYADDVVTRVEIPGSGENMMALRLTFAISALIRSANKSHDPDKIGARERFSGVIGGVVGGVVMPTTTMPPDLKAIFIQTIIMGLVQGAMIGEPQDPGPSQEVH